MKRLKKAGLWKLITIYDFNVYPSYPQDQNLFYDGKEMNFDPKNIGEKRSRNKTFVSLLNSPVVKAGSFSKPKGSKACGISRTG